MRKFLPLFAVFAVVAVPAAAQESAAPQQPAAEKQKTVTKVVCERVRNEEVTGSRLGAAPKVCKKVQVPAKTEAEKAQPHGHSANAH